MQGYALRIAVKTALVLSLITVSACTTMPGTHAADSVAQAYSAAGIVPVQPYNRSIFSTTNF